MSVLSLLFLQDGPLSFLELGRFVDILISWSWTAPHGSLKMAQYKPEVTAKFGSDCQRFGGLYFRLYALKDIFFIRNRFWRIKFQFCVLTYSGLRLRTEYAKLVWIGRSWQMKLNEPWKHKLEHSYWHCAWLYADLRMCNNNGHMEVWRPWT